MKCLQMPQPWSPMHASMPVTFLWRHLRKHRQPGTRRPRKPPRVIPSPPPPTPQCAGGCKEYSRRGTNATVERFTCVDCGFATTRSKGSTEDPAMCPHVETDTRGSSNTLVRHTCKACLKVILELPRNEATVRESTAKDVSRADTSQFRDISRAMHVRPQMTLNAREVDLVLGLSCCGHPSPCTPWQRQYHLRLVWWSD